MRICPLGEAARRLAFHHILAAKMYGPVAMDGCKRDMNEFPQEPAFRDFSCLGEGNNLMHDVMEGLPHPLFSSPLSP